MNVWEYTYVILDWENLSWSGESHIDYGRHSAEPRFLKPFPMTLTRRGTHLPSWSSVGLGESKLKVRDPNEPIDFLWISHQYSIGFPFDFQ